MLKFYFMQFLLIIVYFFTFGFMSVGISYGDEYCFLVQGWGSDEILDVEMQLVPYGE
jgi:hypothetical protein